MDENLDLEVRLFGINRIGHEQFNDFMCQFSSIPWLQDTGEDDGMHLVWDRWKVTEYDVYILDEQNQLITVYNLKDHDLQLEANYNELKRKLVEAAQE